MIRVERRHPINVGIDAADQGVDDMRLVELNWLVGVAASEFAHAAREFPARHHRRIPSRAGARRPG